MKTKVILSALVVLVLGYNWLDNRDSTYTLYRNSVNDENSRIHVASFDADTGPRYNGENCQISQELFQAQPGIKTKFWCEKGRFKE